MDYKQLISKPFWLQIDYTAIHKSDYAFLILGGVSFLVALALLFFKKKFPTEFERTSINKIANAGIWIGFLLGLWFGLRWEHIRFFGTRAVALVIVLTFGLRILWVLGKLAKNLGPVRQKQVKEEIKQKYLNLARK